MAGDDGAALPVADSTQLAHALAGTVAAESGLRLLTIKGPATDRHGLRRPRASADADLLVDPVDFDRFCEQLENRGWHTRHGRETPSVLPPHSRTYIHDNWSCDIDVHSSFPGFFGGATAAFDALWESRVVVPIAHAAVFAPSRAGSAVIAALHAQRSSRSARQQDEEAQLREIIRTDFRDDERFEFYRIALAGGAVWVLRDLIGPLDLGPVVSDARPEDQRLWDLNRTYNEDGSAVGWLLHWRASKWTQRFTILGRALWVARADVPRNDPGTLPAHSEAWRYRLVRWRRGAKALGRFIAGSWQRKRSRG